MADSEHVAATGSVRVVEYAILRDKSMPAKLFLYGELIAQDRNPLLALFAHVANNGEMGIHDDRKVKQERPPFWTFKRNKCKKGNDKGWIVVRMPFFRHGNRIIITHGFWKPPKSQWPEEEFIRAEAIRQEFLRIEQSQNQQRGK